jgi:imidazolonepropionase
MIAVPMPHQLILDSTEQIWADFRIATLARNVSQPYGLLIGYWMGTSGGKIAWLEPQPPRLPKVERASWIWGKQQLLTPGLIDCHTHCVYGGNRADEWERRLSGESYQTIAASGGGILSTVRATRLASEEALVASAALRVGSFLAEGVTTMEIKSGYGLNMESELKMLRVARRLAVDFGIDVEPTLLAAHAVPPEYHGRSDDYVQWVCRDMIPAAKEHCTAVDVFCESIAFTVAQSTQVLQTALDCGLKIKTHAEQLSHQGFATVAAKMGALSVDHIEFLPEVDCQILARCGTVATLLPGAFYYLRETQKPPVKRLLAEAVPIAVSTDCNPGSSPILSLRAAANLACVLFGLTPEQAIMAITRNAADALGIAQRCGTIEVGKDADLAIWDVSSPAEICYALGGNPCVASFKRAKRIRTQFLN